MTDALEISRPPLKAFGVKACENKPPRVVIVGGGFAGLAAARALRGCAAEIVLIDIDDENNTVGFLDWQGILKAAEESAASARTTPSACPHWPDRR